MPQSGAAHTHTLDTCRRAATNEPATCGRSREAPIKSGGSANQQKGATRLALCLARRYLIKMNELSEIAAVARR